MATTPNSIITAQTPYMKVGDLTAATACTTRAPTATASLAGANIIEMVGTSTNGRRIDWVQVKAASSSYTAASAAEEVVLWLWDGTTAWPFKEILTAAVTPSTTVASYDSGQIPLGIVLPSTWKIYASVSITTAANTTAMVAVFSGADL